MKVSDIVRQETKPERRRIGIVFSQAELHKVMATAVDLYKTFGVDVEVDNATISIMVGKDISEPFMRLIERRTGHPAFNDWW